MKLWNSTVEYVSNKIRIWDRNMKKIDLKNQYKSGLNYTKSYVTLNEENASDSVEFTIYANRLANYLVKTFERHNIYLANKSLLEIGCGMGRLMKPLSTHFYWVSGVDISKEILQELQYI